MPVHAGGGRPSQPSPYAAPESGNSVGDFYRSRGGAPLWFAPRSGTAAQQLLQLLGTAQADNLNPNRYRVKALAKVVQAAQRGDPAARQRAEGMLSQAYIAYARDLQHDPRVGIIYVDPELRPAPASGLTLLNRAASAPSLSQYVGQMGWMNPVYAQLRQALASRMYRTERELLMINFDGAGAAVDKQSYVLIIRRPRGVHDENGQVGARCGCRGRPDPIDQTPMMTFIRYAALTPIELAPDSPPAGSRQGIKAGAYL